MVSITPTPNFEADWEMQPSQQKAQSTQWVIKMYEVKKEGYKTWIQLVLILFEKKLNAYTIIALKEPKY